MSFITDSKKPAIILTVIFAITGWALTFYLYQQSKRTRRPVYAVNSEVIKVYDSSKKSPNLILLNDSQEEITKDVFLLTIRFWNAGTTPIEPEEIRAPVKFVVTNCEEIVDYDVVTQTNPETTHFSLSYGNDKKSVLLSWSHLDPGNGAKFSVFYTGPPEPEYLLTGNILGRTSFPETVSSKWSRNPFLAGIPTENEFMMIFYWITSIFLIMVAVRFPRFVFPPTIPRSFRLLLGIVGGFLLVFNILETLLLLVFGGAPPL